MTPSLIWYRNNRERALKNQHNWYRKNSLKISQEKRLANLRRYGLTEKAFGELLERQHGVCAICKQPPTGKLKRLKVLHVDHDKETGWVRGLLCHKCNLALGALGDSIEGLMRAIDYLRGRT